MPLTLRRPVLKKAAPSMSDLAGLMAFVNADDKNKLDVICKGSEVTFTDRKTLALKTKDGTEEFAFTAHSFDQMAGMLKIPTKYLEACKVTGKGGMQDQIEAKMEQRLANDHLIRLRRTPLEGGVSGLIRAFLPGDYTAFDYRDMLPTLHKAMLEVGEPFKLELSNATDPKSIEQKMHLRFVKEASFNFDDLEIDDPHKIGFHCGISEIGEGPISVNTIIYRLVCKNGATGWNESEVLKIQNRHLQKHEVLPQMSEAIFAAVRQEEPLKALLSQKYCEIVPNPEISLLLMAAKMKVGDHVKDAALKIMAQEAAGKAVTKFDLMQAFTRCAHGLSIEERVKLETAVGKYMFGSGKAVKDAPIITVDESN